MTEYVLGFLFSEDLRKVVLIRKQKPEWQANKLNGVGGKIEEGESVPIAMIREFKEEAGLDTSNWEPIARLNGSDFIVYCLYKTGDLTNVTSKEAEKVDIYNVEDIVLRNEDVISNLPWLINLALDKLTGKSNLTTIDAYYN